MVIRGVLIKHGSRIKKERTKQLKSLLEELTLLEEKHKQKRSISVERDLARKRIQITDILYFKAKADIQRCRKISYEAGEKCGKLLARTLRDHKARNYIPQITISNNIKVTKPKGFSPRIPKIFPFAIQPSE